MLVAAKKTRVMKRISPKPSATRSPRITASSPNGYRLRGLQGKLIDLIGSAIVNGEYKAGEYLPVDQELCKRFKASRPTIREVIRVLEAKGLVQMRQKVGTSINKSSSWNIIDANVLAWLRPGSLTDELLRDLIEMRQLIEPAAAKLAAGRASLPEIKTIQDALTAMRTASKDMVSYAQADVNFHMAIFAASHNALFASLSHVVADLLRLSFEMSQETLNDSDNTVQQDIAEHTDVMDAIARGDGTAAENAMLKVVLNGKAALVRRSKF